MEKIMVNRLINGFRGKDTHVDALKALKGLSAADARNEPSQGIHSIWANLYHILFWHNITRDAVRGAEIDWKSIQGKDWPIPEEMKDDSKWSELVATFEQSIEEAKEILEMSDLSQSIPSWGGMSIAEAMFIIAQHNSYHIGQIVITRQLMGKWPPPKNAES
ncbi:MAG: DinB family protein [Candidatus Hermodarchaeota archaeon]